MIEKLVILASYSYAGEDIGSFLSALDQYGFFSYVLPFLLIFSIVFGILTMTNIFKENKAVNGIIALVIGLMSLQFDIVPRFFAELFPRVGVGLAILLIILIFLGIFAPGKTGVTYTLLGIAGLILVIVLIKTAGSVGWYSGNWWSDNWPVVAGAIFILVIIAVIVGVSNPAKSETLSPILKRIQENS